MSNRTGRLLVVAATLTSLLASRSSAAQDDEAFARANRLRHFAVSGNPLALMIGRYSADLQWIPAEKHAILLSPYGLYSDSTVTPLATGTLTETGFGAELGYRYYSGSRGANGFFAGAGGVLGLTSATAGSAPRSFLSTETVFQDAERFVYIGGFLDVGVQAILDSGFLVGGGAGVQLTKQLVANTSAEVEPRLLFTIGYAL